MYNKWVMNLFSLFASILAVTSAVAVANETPQLTLYSLQRNYSVAAEPTRTPHNMFRFFKAPSAMQLVWKITLPSEKQSILSITPVDVSISDASGSPLEWSVTDEKSRSDSAQMLAFDIENQPKGEWVEIKGSLSVFIATGSVKQPARKVKCGDSGKLDIPGLEITYKWEKGEDITFSMSQADSRRIADIRFKTPAGKTVAVRSSATFTGMDETEYSYGFATDEKEICVVVETYTEPSTVTIPLNSRIGFSGEQK